MDSGIMGINEDELSNLALEINDYSDKISELFDKIDAQMDRVANNYQGSSSLAIINYYKDLRQCYGIVKKNINCYSDDLIALIRRMQESERYIVSLFEDAIQEAKSKVKPDGRIGE